jgi:hypothetical protein
MIDAHSEEIFLLSKGTIHLKSRPSPSTLWRWALRGVRGIVLESIVIGGRRYTSREAVDRFMSRLNESEPVPAPSETKLRAKQKAAASKRAATTL